MRHVHNYRFAVFNECNTATIFNIAKPREGIFQFPRISRFEKKTCIPFIISKNNRQVNLTYSFVFNIRINSLYERTSCSVFAFSMNQKYNKG